MGEFIFPPIMGEDKEYFKPPASWTLTKPSVEQRCEVHLASWKTNMAGT